MISFVPPRVNLNGTSREELLRQQMAVLDALHVLTTAMGAASPHGRDYPDGGQGAAIMTHLYHRRMVEDLLRHHERIAATLV